MRNHLDTFHNWLVSEFEQISTHIVEMSLKFLQAHFLELIFIFALVWFRKVISGYILKVTSYILNKVGVVLSETQITHLNKPIRLLPIAYAFYLLAPLSQDSMELLSKVLTGIYLSLPTIAVFWILYVLVDHLEEFAPRLEEYVSQTMFRWFVRVLEIIIILLAIATVLEIWGVDVAPIIASLGLFGVAVALGAQDLFKNLIGGMLVIAERRFNPGDWIKVPGVVEGTVEHIGFRSTLVRQFDKAPVYVPNTKFSDTSVVNYSGMTHRRIYWKIGVEYNTSIDQLKNIRSRIEDYILKSADFASPEEVSTFVRIDSFNDSSIDIMLYCFTKTTKWGEWLAVKEELAYNIKDIVENEGSSFAFPSRTLYHDFVGDVPENFIPPKNKK